MDKEIILNAIILTYWNTSFKTVIVPFNRNSYNYSVVKFVIAVLISPKRLFPLNLGPNTGKLGSAYSFTYLSKLVSICMLSTLISSFIYSRYGYSCCNSDAFLLTIVSEVIGCFRDTFLTSLNFRAVSITLINISICCII